MTEELDPLLEEYISDLEDYHGFERYDKNILMLEIDRRLKLQEKQKEAIKQIKAFCEIFNGRTILPENLLNLLDEYLPEGDA